jgi:hypothetical protein
MLRTATFAFNAARARPTGAIGLLRGEGFAFAFNPFPYYEDKGFRVRPERSRARGLCAFIEDP